MRTRARQAFHAISLAGCLLSERAMPGLSAARQTKNIANAFCDVFSRWSYGHKVPDDTEPRKATEYLQLTEHPLIFTTLVPSFAGVGDATQVPLPVRRRWPCAVLDPIRRVAVLHA